MHLLLLCPPRRPRRLGKASDLLPPVTLPLALFGQVNKLRLGDLFPEKALGCLSGGPQDGLLTLLQPPAGTGQLSDGHFHFAAALLPVAMCLAFLGAESG